MKVLLVIPPLVQANTPYSATPLLMAFLRKHGYPDAVQADASLQLILTVFSKSGLSHLFSELQKTCRAGKKVPAIALHLLDHRDQYIATIDPVISFLQGADPSLAYRIGRRDFLPEGARFKFIQEDQESDHPLLERAFGSLSQHDKSRYIASLYLDDITDGLREGLDGKFDLSRYGEHLAAAAHDFTPLECAVKQRGTPIDRMIDGITKKLHDIHKPDFIGFTIPFPGAMFGALRMAREFRRHNPSIVIAVGGGYVSTEWRTLSDKRLFNYIDHVVFDDGEWPLLRLIQSCSSRHIHPFRTLSRDHRTGKIVRSPDKGPVLRHRQRPPPDYAGLPLNKYFPVVEMLNPMHRLWADQRWNKLALAHGCYWHRCRFCDTSLDYIHRFDPAPAKTIVDWIVQVIKSTGQTGFHFTDEAAPPALLRQLADELIKRQLTITWWANIRFEPGFSPLTIERLAASGCIAISGGLETAESRTLELLNKGIDLRHVARLTHQFSQHGIMVHAYLMYGVPSQTHQEIVDALEYVRQLFHAGCIQSAFWHRFALTVHSQFYHSPDIIGITPVFLDKDRFSCNEIDYTHPSKQDYTSFGKMLYKAVYNFMHGIGLDHDVCEWFGKDSPCPRLKPDFVERALRRRESITNV